MGGGLSTAAFKGKLLRRHRRQSHHSSATLKLNYVPVEILERVLMAAFLTLYSTGSRDQVVRGMTSESERFAFTHLASVCSFWRNTLRGWPQSPTRLWVRHKLRKLIRRKCLVFSEGTWISGLTFLDGFIYVLHRKSSEQIEVFDADCYSFQQSITVPGLCRSNDMIACAHNRCLYVASGSDGCVHRVRLPPGAGTTQWSVHDDAHCLSLSITHAVLVTCRRAGKIKEFSTEGELLREVRLPQDVVLPLHRIQLSNGQSIMCHGEGDDPTGLHRVCLVGSDGHLVKSIGGPPGSGSQQMNEPCHLAVGRNGFVFVADSNNRRVLLLSPELSYVRAVVSGDQLRGRPNIISSDVHRRSLYIADCAYGFWNVSRVVVVKFAM